MKVIQHKLIRRYGEGWDTITDEDAELVEKEGWEIVYFEAKQGRRYILQLRK